MNDTRTLFEYQRDKIVSSVNEYAKSYYGRKPHYNEIKDLFQALDEIMKERRYTK